MLDHPETVFPDDILHVNHLRVARVCHAVVADKHDIDYVCKITRLERCVEVLGEYIYLTKRFL